MKENRKSNELLAACPRCGYELRGIVDSWTESCPLLGVCSECGLDFNWSEVLHPEKYEPLWCVEFPNAWSLPRSALKTYLMSFRPARFWRELKMSNDVRWRKLLVYVLLLTTPFILCYVIEQATVATLVWRYTQQRLLLYQQQTQSSIVQFQQQIDQLKLFENPPTQKIDNWQRQLDSMKLAAQKAPSINFTLAEAMFEAVLLPLSSYSNGTLVLSSGNQTYPPPIKLHEIAIKQYRLLRFPRSLGLRIRQTIRNIIMQGILFPGIPLAFLLLPISRQIAKVRWRHIIRVLLYSLFLPVTLCCMLVILFTTGTFIAPLESVSYRLGAELFNYGIWIALITWWALATKYYLKMPHGWMIAIVFALLIAMLTASVLFLFAPTLMIDV